jgi:hypothetical protein
VAERSHPPSMWQEHRDPSFESGRPIRAAPTQARQANPCSRR